MTDHTAEPVPSTPADPMPEPCHLTLGDVIERLRKETDQSRLLRLGWREAYSYRGYYEQLAFELAENVTVADMLACAENARGRMFYGWKGGEYTMDVNTDVWLVSEPRATGETLGAVLLEMLLRQSAEPLAQGGIVTPDAQAVEPTPFDQPDGIDGETYDLPDPARAADRVRLYIEATGDGLYDVQGGMPLYARDLEALRRASDRGEAERRERAAYERGRRETADEVERICNAQHDAYQAGKAEGIAPYVAALTALATAVGQYIYLDHASPERTRELRIALGEREEEAWQLLRPTGGGQDGQ